MEHPFCARNGARHRGEARPASSQFDGRDRHKQEMIPEHALGAVETPRRGGSSHSGQRRQVKLSGGSRTAPSCSSNHLRLSCISQAFKEKNKFTFLKLALFQFYQLPWLR